MSTACPTCGRSVSLVKAVWARCAGCHTMVFEAQPGPKVLVAHESPALATRIALVLFYNGMSPVHAASGDAAMRLMRELKPRAAVLDVALSGVMSFQIIDYVRSEGSLARTPIVLVASVFNRTAYKRRPVSLYGADDYVEQHHLHDMLPRKIEKLLGLSQARPMDGQSVAEMAVVAQDTRPELQGGERLRALARSIVADIALYHQDDIARAARGEVSPALQKVLEEGRVLLRDMTRGAGHAEADPADAMMDAFRALMADVRGVNR